MSPSSPGILVKQKPSAMWQELTHPSESKDSDNKPNVSAVPGKRAAGAADKVSGACTGRAASVTIASPAACSRAGGSLTSSAPVISSTATSESSRGFLLGPSGVVLLLRKEDILVSNPRRQAWCVPSRKKSKIYLQDRFVPEKNHLCSVRPPKMLDQDGDPASSSVSARGGRTHSDTCSESGDAGSLVATWGLATLEPGGFPAAAAEEAAPAALATGEASSSSSSSSEDHGSSGEASL